MKTIFDRFLHYATKPGAGEPRTGFFRPQKKHDREKAEEAWRRRQGIKAFDYGEGRVIYARNKKNADRKARNRGWI